jgi:hypothetical protein
MANAHLDNSAYAPPVPVCPGANDLFARWPRICNCTGS